MAQFVIAPMFGLCLLFASIDLYAGAEPQVPQNLPDPTRPPASILNPGGGTEQEVGPVLQSILISANRKIAIIDGQAVKLNAKFGDQTLIRMTESEVVLRRGKQLQTLSLHPDLRKKPSQGSTKLK